MAHSACPPPCLRAIRSSAFLFSVGAVRGFLLDGSGAKNAREVYNCSARMAELVRSSMRLESSSKRGTRCAVRAGRNSGGKSVPEDLWGEYLQGSAGATAHRHEMPYIALLHLKS